MTTTIVTRFTIGTPQGIDTILSIGTATAMERYDGKVPEDQLKAYIQNNFNTHTLHVEMNSMSNQFLVVYVDDEPAGYARVTSKGKRPDIFNNKTVIRIADFGVLNKFDDLQIKKSLFEKCLAVCKMQQVVWLNEYKGNVDLAFFESYGFIKNTDLIDAHELDLTPVYLVNDRSISTNN